MSQALAELYRHNLWANSRLLDACAGLTDEQLDASTPGTYGSIRKTLVHIFLNEENYLALVTGEPSDPPLTYQEGFPGFDVLRQHARRSGEGLIQAASEIDPNRILHGDFRGEAYALPVTTPLIQAINHATEHRAQIATILSQQGIQPPVLDGWTYGEEAAG